MLYLGMMAPGVSVRAVFRESMIKINEQYKVPHIQVISTDARPILAELIL